MKRFLAKSCVVFLVAGLCLAFLPSAEARPHLPRKAAKGAAHVAKKLANILRCN